MNILRREGQPVAYYITKVTYMNLSGYRYTGRCILPFDGGWPPRKDEKRIKGWFKDPYNKKFDSSANTPKPIVPSTIQSFHNIP